MKKSKNIAITEALSEGTIVSSGTFTVPAKWKSLGDDEKVSFVVLQSKKDCETEGGYVTGLHTFINDVPRSLAKARTKDGSVSSWDDVDEGAVVAICHNNYYRIFTNKKSRDIVLMYCIVKQYFEYKGIPSTFPNHEAAICSYMLSEGIKPSSIIRAMKYVSAKTAKECKAFLKQYKPAVDVSMAGAVDDSNATDAEPKKADSTAADAAAQPA